MGRVYGNNAENRVEHELMRDGLALLDVVEGVVRRERGCFAARLRHRNL
jgi:hypothetical protein